MYVCMYVTIISKEKEAINLRVRKTWERLKQRDLGESERRIEKGEVIEFDLKCIKIKKTIILFKLT